MRINPYNSQGINPYNRQNNSQGKTNNKPAGKTKDQVEISAAAKDMQQVSQTETERQAKIDQLKLQVENGTYKVDPKTVAQSIVNFYTKK